EGCPGRPAGGCRRGKRWRSRRGRRRRVRRRTDDGGPARGAGPPFVCVLVVGGRGLGASTVRPHKGAVCPGARLMRAGGKSPSSSVRRGGRTGFPAASAAVPPRSGFGPASNDLSARFFRAPCGMLSP